MLLSATNAYILRKYSCEESVELMHAAGFDAMDFYFNGDPMYYDESTDSTAFKDRFLRLRAMAEEKGMCFNQAHAPYATSFNDEELTKKRFYDVTRSIRNASYLGVPTIVVHPMQHLTYAETGVPEKLFEMNMDFYRRLIPYSEEYRVKIALENMYQRPYGLKLNHSTCSKPEEFIRYMNELNNDCFVACLDLGHTCLVCEDTADFIRKLGHNRLKALHVHDVDGMDDTHTVPYHGIINWDQVMGALKEINYSGDFTFEVAGQYLRSMPKELFPTALKHLAATGRYLIGKL